MSSESLRLLVVDNDSFFTTHIEYYCTVNDWDCRIEERLPDKNFNFSCDYVLLDDSLVNGDVTVERKITYQQVFQQLKNNTDSAKIILYSQYEVNRDALEVLLEPNQGKPPLLHEVTSKPYDLKKLRQSHKNNEKVTKRPKQLALETNLKLPLAIAIFNINDVHAEQPLWSNHEWDKRELSNYDERLLRLTLHELEQNFLAGKEALPRKFRFPSTRGEEIVDWHFWLVSECVYFSRNFQPLSRANDNFNYLDAERDPVKRFKKVRDLLAQRYGISRIRIYETDALRDSFNDYESTVGHKESLMIPRFVSGGGTVDEKGNYSTRSWFVDAFRQRSPVNRARCEKITEDIYLETVEDGAEGTEKNDSQQEIEQDGCRSIHWGKAGTRAQITVRDKQKVEWGHIALDQRLDHMRRDRNNGKLREELAMVLRANPFVSPEGKTKIGIPPLSAEEVSALLPFLNMLNPAVSRWLKARREKSLQHWHLVSSLILRNVLGKKFQEPAEAYQLIFEAMVAVWPLMQGLRLPGRAYLENIIPEHSNEQEWTEMLSRLHRTAARPGSNTVMNDNPASIPLDEFITHHGDGKGLSNLYIAQQFEKDCFQVLGGYGALGLDIRQIGKPWDIIEPHQHAFEKACALSPEPTAIQDYQAWSKSFRKHSFDEKSQKWRNELKKIGSWCALPITLNRRTGYPVLLVVTSHYKNYFSDSRIELLQRLANRLLPMLLWHEEWQQVGKVTQAITHGLNENIGELKHRIDSEDWKSVHALMPLLDGFHNNFKRINMTKKAVGTVDKPAYVTHFSDVLHYLSAFKAHDSYAAVLKNWEQWQQYEALKIRVPKFTLQHVIYNLLVNAKQYAVPGTVRMEGLLKTNHLELFLGNECLFELTDYDRHYLFAEGYRPQGGTGSGSGLGLAIARELAEESGAKLALCEGDDSFSMNCFSDTAASLRFCIKLTLPLAN